MNKGCDTCNYVICGELDYPCCECKAFNKWKPAHNRTVVGNDPVNHPSHYTKGKIEVIDFIADQKLNFARGNAVKYVCRAGSKNPETEIQDLEKAVWYINHEIKMLKGETNNGTKEET